MTAPPMTLLIIGGAGMLGHRLLADLSAAYPTWATVRGRPDTLAALPGVDPARILSGVDALRFESVARAVAIARPAVVINCVGLIKQRADASDPLLAIDINARFPHQLAALCAAAGARLIHISTDCVFDGRQGLYREDDPVSAQDVYGRTKALGEVTDQPGALTLRTSLIGRELGTRYGLLEWFLAQPGPVTGYTRAVFSGFPTGEVAAILRDYVLPRPDLHGLYHLAAAPISKYDLLALFNAAYRRAVEIIPTEQVVIDRSLDGSRFNAATGFAPKPWDAMVAALAQPRA
ncbi:MAG: NAD(P)-dependent oxidoreductase [Chloroflexota bacterium]|nr:MAG: NAD(P)-dependent oxidoreductase [Chloroflexota bacterium]